MKKYFPAIMLFSLFCFTNSFELQAMDEGPPEQEDSEQIVQSKIQALEVIVKSKIEKIREKPTKESSKEESYLSKLLILLTLLQRQDFHPAMTIAAKIDLDQLISFFRDKDIFSQLKEILELHGIAIDETK